MHGLPPFGIGGIPVPPSIVENCRSSRLILLIEPHLCPSKMGIHNEVE